MSHYVFTSESVTEGHPDKLCDRISDAVVGHYLLRDPGARVVAECAVSTGIVFVSVKLRSRASVNVTEVARDVIRRTGYRGPDFDARSCTVMTSLNEVAVNGGPRIPVPEGGDLESMTAEDQATLFGFACTHTPALLPLPIWLAHRLARRLAAARRDLPYLSPDGKTQVAIELEGTQPRRVHGVTVIATDRGEDAPAIETLRRDVREHVVEPAFADEPIRPDDRTRIMINPEGHAAGGPSVHAGLTGRKTAVDTYGEFARHGSAALSGKDCYRIDRIGAYAARHVAKNVVAAGLAEACEVQLSYAIGLARPVSVHIDTFGTGRVSDDEIGRRVERAFDLRVGAVVRSLGLCELPRRDDGDFFQKLAAYGHVGRPELHLPWEATDRVDRLR